MTEKTLKSEDLDQFIGSENQFQALLDALDPPIHGA